MCVCAGREGVRTPLRKQCLRCWFEIRIKRKKSKRFLSFYSPAAGLPRRLHAMHDALGLSYSYRSNCNSCEVIVMCPHPQSIRAASKEVAPAFGRFTTRNGLFAIDHLRSHYKPRVAFKARHVRHPQPVRKGPRRTSGCSPVPALKVRSISKCSKPLPVPSNRIHTRARFSEYARWVSESSELLQFLAQAVPPTLPIARHICNFLQTSNHHAHLLSLRTKAIVSLVPPDSRHLKVFIQVFEPVSKFTILTQLKFGFKKAVSICRRFES